MIALRSVVVSPFNSNGAKISSPSLAAEASERYVDRAAPDRTFEGERIRRVSIRLRVTQNVAKNFLAEQVTDFGFL